MWGRLGRVDVCNLTLASREVVFIFEPVTPGSQGNNLMSLPLSKGSPSNSN